ncbi:MAG: CDP-glycerol glycerophosphotransferase family protein, partial [Tomitella sp.]|nr:CDP-glycerol glycerophosphotransferase family protein [Tomitella sp.]
MPVHFSGSQAELETDEALSGHLRLSVDGKGRLRCEENVRHAVVTALDVADDCSSFTVHGLAATPGGRSPHLALGGTSGMWSPEALIYDPRTSRFAATFSPLEARWSKQDVPRASDGWSLRLLTEAGSLSRSIWVPVATTRIADVEQQYLAWHENERSAFRFTVTAGARALWVNTRPPLGEAFGRYPQRRLQEQIPALLRSPLRNVVLFSSYNGKSASDSPLEIHRELRRRGVDADLVWSVSDHAAEAPSDARSVLVGTHEYYECLHTSRYLVNNNNFPYYFEKHPDQTYLQTWHGTPLKRIGNDVPSANLSLSYRALMRREAAAWDFLLAQNSFAADALPAAFGYDGEVLSLGYPRNDILAGSSAELVDSVRQRVGVRPGQQVVLYAPTWRDTVKTSSGRYAFVNYLKLDEVSAALGDDTVLLVRGHSNTQGMAAGTTPANIVDVSTYPNVAELMLISDALVTDYSSIMFDFAVTGRPMVFLVPDIEEYAGTTRGFYLDFREIAPGPMHATTDEVLGSLSAPDRLGRDYHDRYESFRQQF